MSADGSTWVFSSTKPLRGSTTDPLPRPSRAANNLASEVYRYVVGDDNATCISCPAPGAPSSLGASIDAFGPHDTGVTVGSGKPGRPSRNVSTDGKRVFFYTPNALLPEDANTKGDVYLWEDGALSLISTGKSARNTYLLDSSASGDDVFIASVEELFPGDVDEAYDVYDVRVGGGQAAIAKDESCSGDNCQGSLTSPLGAATPASAAFQGLGNPPVIELPPAGRRQAAGRQGQDRPRHVDALVREGAGQGCDPRLGLGPEVQLEGGEQGRDVRRHRAALPARSTHAGAQAPGEGADQRAVRPVDGQGRVGLGCGDVHAQVRGSQPYVGSTSHRPVV